MPREIQVIWAGRHHRSQWEELCGEYRERISKLIPIVDLPIRHRSGNDPGRQREEGRAIVRALPDPCWTFALDGRGKTMSSTAFATKLQSLQERWPHPLVFIVGSDLGLDRKVLDRANTVLSFGAMTFGHELARLVLYEQIYRGLSLNRGIKYHR